jgi:hypothetical protein
LADHDGGADGVTVEGGTTVGGTADGDRMDGDAADGDRMDGAPEPAPGSWPAGGRADGATAGTREAATGEPAMTGAPPPMLTWVPWLGRTVRTTAAVAAAKTRSAIAPVTIPVRKLTSSSRALMAVRMPGHEPAIR